MTYKYVGQTIRDYLILDKIDKYKYAARCIHCGLERTYFSQAISKGSKGEGNALICTCSLSGIKVGDKYGRLTVLSRDIENTSYGRVSWKCKCDCGKEITVIGKALKSGNTRSCGCLRLETSVRNIKKCHENLEDLVGEKRGLLTIVRLASEKEVFNRPKGMRYWICKCDCGNEHIVSTSDFKNGKVQSCGCLKSKGEAKIESILVKNSIDFAKQYTFYNFVGKHGKSYAFDFGIVDNDGNLRYLIEYDGCQHFDINHQFGNNRKEAFLTVQERDKIKNEYCFSHNIPLIRIPYTHFNKLEINDLKLETTNFLIKRIGDE